jgi:stalled ribosome rescue protein Dom34
MAAKRKLEEEAISKILVADTDFKSRAEASDTEEEEEEEEEVVVAAASFQPGDRLKEGTAICIPFSVQPKV